MVLLLLLIGCGGPADPWSKVPLAEGAVRSAQASTATAFRNAAGDIACPVMGASIATAEDAVSFVDHGGVRYFMCCDACEKAFLDDPESYANGKYIEEHGLDPTAPSACEE